jgi:hypothetical protein
MSSAFDWLEWVNHGVDFLGMTASGACLLACIIYRRVSSAMTLLILAFAVDVVAMLLYLVLGLTNSLLADDMPIDTRPLYSLLAFFSFATTALTAVGLFLVFGDIVRRLDRLRVGGSPDDQNRRRPPGFDDRDDPRWERSPDGPNIRR